MIEFEILFRAVSLDAEMGGGYLVLGVAAQSQQIAMNYAIVKARVWNKEQDVFYYHIEQVGLAGSFDDLSPDEPVIRQAEGFLDGK